MLSPLPVLPGNPANNLILFHLLPPCNYEQLISQVTFKMFASANFQLRKSRFRRRQRNWIKKYRRVWTERIVCYEKTQRMHSVSAQLEHLKYLELRGLQGFSPIYALNDAFLFSFCRSRSLSSVQDPLIPSILLKVHDVLISVFFCMSKFFLQPLLHVQISALPHINCLDFGGLTLIQRNRDQKDKNILLSFTPRKMCGFLRGCELLGAQCLLAVPWL